MMQVTTFGYGRHRTDTLILAAILRLEQKVDQLMSQDQTIAAEAAAEEADIQAVSTALASIQALLVTLQGEQGLSEATLAAAAQVQTDLGSLASTAQADEAADQPPAPPAGG
jgi:allophanate hydrolase subunit 1